MLKSKYWYNLLCIQAWMSSVIEVKEPAILIGYKVTYVNETCWVKVVHPVVYQ